MAKGKSTWKYNKLLTARRNYFDGLSGPSQIQRITNPPALSTVRTELGSITPPQTITSPVPQSQGASNPGGLFGAAASDTFNMIGGITNVAGTIGGQLLSQGMESKVGSGLQKIGTMSSSIPVIGSYVSGALNLLGGGINALWGSKLNQANINAANADINRMNSARADATDFDMLNRKMASTVGRTAHDKSFYGRDGLFSNKAGKIQKKLEEEARIASERQALALVNNTEDLNSNQLMGLEANYAALGGPMDFGGGAIGFDFMNRYIRAKEASAEGKNKSITSLPNSFANGGSSFGNYDNTLFGSLTNYAENPDSTGFDRVLRVWVAPPSKKGYDPNNRGMGVDINTNPRVDEKLKGVTKDKKGNKDKSKSYLTEEDERFLRHSSMRDAEKSYQQRVNYANDRVLGRNRKKSIVPSALKSSLVKDLIYYRGSGTVARGPFEDTDFMSTLLNGTDQELYDKVKEYYKDDTRASRITKYLNEHGYPNIRSLGGNIATHGANFTNGLMSIDNGGSHETNPYEGVPMGADPKGTPNLVEEGETIFNDYVFSRRLTVPKAIRNKYKLRGNKNITFAEASKQLAKESEERPNDPVSERGLVALMSDLANAQENVKGEQQMRQFAKGGRLFKEGGRPNRYKGLGKSYNRGWFDSNGRYTQEYLDRVNNMTLDQLQAQFDRQREFYADEANRGTERWRSIDNFYRKNPGYNSPDYRVTKADLTFAKEGAQDYNPGYLHDLALEATTPAPTPEPRTAEAKRYFTYGTTDPLDYFEGRNDKGQTWFDLNPGYSFVDKNGTVRDPIDVDGVSTTYTDYYLKKNDPEVTATPEDEEWKQGKYADWLRYAPAVGFGIGAITDALGITNKPDYANANAILEATRGSGTYQPVEFNPIGNYLTYNPLDRDYYLNKMSAEAGATRRAILQNAGMNRGAGMAAILAADNNAQGQLGALARQAEEYNLAQRQKIEEFNRGTNMFNSEGFLKADMANQDAQAKLRDFNLKGTLAAAEMRERARMAADQAKSANLSGLFQILGDIGYEEKNARMRDWAIRHGVFGPGTEDYGRIRKASKGGKLKRKRKGLTF